MRDPVLVDWSACVPINLDTIGGPCLVGSTREAAMLLVECWPVHHGRAFVRALQLCADALEDEASADQARGAFVAAAQEANIILTLH